MREERSYKAKIINSNKSQWIAKSGKIHNLERSYSSQKEKDRKWKNINSLSCGKPIKFKSGGDMSSISNSIMKASKDHSSS